MGEFEFEREHMLGVAESHALKCFQCVAEYRLAQQNYDAEQERARTRPGYEVDPEITEPDIEMLSAADTWVPVWQQQQVPGQTLMACVALPVCLPHVTARPKSAEEKAVEGGKLLQGGVIPPRGQVN
jgi:hypothetical protein